MSVANRKICVRCPKGLPLFLRLVCLRRLLCKKRAYNLQRLCAASKRIMRLDIRVSYVMRTFSHIKIERFKYLKKFLKKYVNKRIKRKIKENDEGKSK